MNKSSFRLYALSFLYFILLLLIGYFSYILLGEIGLMGYILGEATFAMIFTLDDWSNKK